MQNEVDHRGTPAYPVSSVGHALGLLSLLGERQQVRVTEAASALGTARSTAHRLLAMLEHHRYVQQDPRTRAYGPGPALFQLALSVVGNLDVRALARPALERLSAEVGETVHLVVLRGHSTLFVESVESARSVRIGSRAGRVMPAHCTAGGKAMLAELPREELRQRYAGDALEPMTPRSRTDLEGLEAELEEVRRRGFATNVGESEDDVAAVAVPVRGAPSDHRMAITVSAPLARFVLADAPRIAEAARRAAGALATAPPTPREGPAATL